MNKEADFLYCHCKNAKILNSDKKRNSLKNLFLNQNNFKAVPDLCELSANKSPLLKDIANSEKPHIAACYPRAVKHLFSSADAPLPTKNSMFWNMRTEANEEITEEELLDFNSTESNIKISDKERTVLIWHTKPLKDEILDSLFTISADLLDQGFIIIKSNSKPLEDSLGSQTITISDEESDLSNKHFNLNDTSTKQILIDIVDTKTEKEKDWKPWFPVIDYDRCTNCMQCLTFCLFDVYGVDDEQNIKVSNESNCKTDCPACSRVCPEVAIMFPKYTAGPINGDIVKESDQNREKMKIDVSALLGGDIYSKLKDRNKNAQKRFSKERDDKKALNERKRCLTELGIEEFITPEILNSLPSMDQIQNKMDQLATMVNTPKKDNQGDKDD